MGVGAEEFWAVWGLKPLKGAADRGALGSGRVIAAAGGLCGPRQRGGRVGAFSDKCQNWNSDCSGDPWEGGVGPGGGGGGPQRGGEGQGACTGLRCFFAFFGSKVLELRGRGRRAGQGRQAGQGAQNRAERGRRWRAGQAGQDKTRFQKAGRRAGDQEARGGQGGLRGGHQQSANFEATCP